MLPKRKWNVKGIVGCLCGRNANAGLSFSSNIKRLETIEAFVLWIEYKVQP